ncbi:WXG100 family type VII secretion target [Galbitalea sp. SE-J8]|uniref:WXG100 family type VII secretion target n=1 Tax=Galbitalea sp. SE-J8 TaxID=3054952 RepID=UPI00259D301B|nr:WXG100 family type VII secretion target [Galbitalea sp. SE-J8]MDM4763738.1 WXG100 family type VII secretion target [Galbitalea sp. SE-J8]
MSTFQVDSEAVATAVGAVQGSIARLEAEVIALHGQLTGLQGSWTGSASVAFQSAVTDWKTVEQRVHESLSGLTTALGQAGRQYSDVETANARLFAH